MGKRKKKSEWIVEMDCPFCGTTIVEAVDHGALPRDMPVVEREAITCTDKGNDAISDYCEHVAFFSDWAYAGAEVPNEWKSQMQKVAQVISKVEGDLIVQGKMENGFAKTIDDYRIYDDDNKLKNIIKKALPEYDVALVKKYIEKFDGVSSGGPSYVIIFLKKKKTC